MSICIGEGPSGRKVRLAPCARLIIALVRFYQRFLSPLIPQRCRFYPSCSEYMIQAVRKKGVCQGVLMGMWRIMRCNPFSPGGYDPVE